MLLYLMFKPQRTRDYTRTPFDFDHDFLVPMHELAAVCADEPSAQAAGQRIVEELMADCRFWNEPPLQLTMELKIWQEYMPVVWNNSVVADKRHFNDGYQPKSVTVIMEPRKKQIWDSRGSATTMRVRQVIGGDAPPADALKGGVLAVHMPVMYSVPAAV